MSDEAKVQNVNFSLPYREGMEAQAGFVSKGEGTSKTFPDEKNFAKFKFPLDNTIVVSEADALEAGYRVLRQNKQRSALIGQYASQFGIQVAGAAGGVTKTDKKVLGSMFELSTNYVKIQAALQRGNVSAACKALTVAELKDLAEGGLKPIV